MNKTLKNILQHPHIALTCWTGCEGIQIKGIANYQTQGGIFDYVCEQISHTNPERIVHGVILITPHSLFDISLPKNSKNKKTTN